MASPHHQHDDLATADGDPMSPAAHSHRMNRDEHTPSDAPPLNPSTETPPVAPWRAWAADLLRDDTVQGLLTLFALGVVILTVGEAMPVGMWRANVVLPLGVLCTGLPILVLVLGACWLGATALIEAIADRLDGGHR